MLHLVTAGMLCGYGIMSDKPIHWLAGFIVGVMGFAFLHIANDSGRRQDAAALRRQQEQQAIENDASVIRGMIDKANNIHELLAVVDTITTFQVTYNGFYHEWGNVQAAAWVDSLRLALSRRQREVLGNL